MKALVTGGGGFLGSRIVQVLHTCGDEVVALGRQAYPHHEQAGIRTVQADIRDAEAVRAACQGMDIVFHVAALPGIWGKRADFWGINVDGTRNVLDACRANKVAKLVFTSSPSVVFGKEPLCGVDESQPYPRKYLAHYPRTKAVAEQMVLAANCSDLATVALRPHLIWGPGDPHLIPRVIARARAGRLIQVGDGNNLVDITYIDNAAEAHLLAADALSPAAPCAGRAYFISQGEPVKLWPWLDDILVAVGAPEVKRRMSFRAAFAVGVACETAYRVLAIRREPPMTRFLATQLAHSHYFNIAAAHGDLGYAATIATTDGLDLLVGQLESG